MCLANGVQTDNGLADDIQAKHLDQPVGED